MTDTKEKILITALHLFSKDGYEAVSVSNIAGELGITKGALYKHYKNKQDIFDSIVERMYRLDEKRSQQYGVPAEKYETAAQEYDSVNLDSIKNFTIAQFSFWTEDDFASNFRKMLTLEQYRNAEMAELYNNCITMGPVAYMEDIFREMMLKGILKRANPELMAIEFYAPMYLFINAWDISENKLKLKEQLIDHVEGFIQNNITKGHEEK